MKNLFIFCLAFTYFSTFSIAQRQITGQIVDSETQKPVKDAKISIRGTDMETISNFLGYFQFTVDSTVTFLVTADGYDGVEAKLSEADGIRISLKKSEEKEIFSPVEEQPEFPGGMPAFYQYIQKNIQWPKKFGEINGKVFVEFVVDKDGSIIKDSVKVVQGLEPWCDAETIRIIQNCPVWTPGKSQGEPVRVRMIFPVTFRSN